MPNRSQYILWAQEAARKYGVPVNYFLRQISQESGWDPNARSKAGAQGIAQFMPATAKGMGINPRNVKQSLFAAARMDAQGYHKYGRWDMAFAAYNAGSGAVDRAGGIPNNPETRHYVAVIMGGGPGTVHSHYGGYQQPGTFQGSPTPPKHPYGAAVSGNVNFAGVDQGIDFTGSGAIHAVGNGVIERIQPSGSGWPGRGALIVYRITSGPAKGKRVYVAEDFVVAGGLHRGSKIAAGQAIGSFHSSYPGIEMGWADANGSPVAPLNPNPHGPKAAGQNFNSFVQTLRVGGPNEGDLYSTPSPEDRAYVENATRLQPNVNLSPTDIQLPDLPKLSPQLAQSMQPQYIAPYKQAASSWQMISNQPQNSPETLQYARNAQVVAGASPNA